MPRGTLFLIVGPSGAGKDSLIASARAQLADRGYLFPRRVITRDTDAGAAEDHIAASPEQFDTDERAGRFALSWRTHATAYAIPATIAAGLTRGQHVVVNVSRTVVASARAKFAPTRVIMVTAAPEVLRHRLIARGRQSDDVDSRATRSVPVAADVTIVNEADLESAIEAFLAALAG